MRFISKLVTTHSAQTVIQLHNAKSRTEITSKTQANKQQEQSNHTLATVTAVKIQRISVQQTTQRPNDWRLVTEKTLYEYIRTNEGK